MGVYLERKSKDEVTQIQAGNSFQYYCQCCNLSTSEFISRMFAFEMGIFVNANMSICIFKT